MCCVVLCCMCYIVIYCYNLIYVMFYPNLVLCLVFFTSVCSVLLCSVLLHFYFCFDFDFVFAFAFILSMEDENIFEKITTLSKY